MEIYHSDFNAIHQWYNTVINTYIQYNINKKISCNDCCCGYGYYFIDINAFVFAFDTQREQIVYCSSFWVAFKTTVWFDSTLTIGGGGFLRVWQSDMNEQITPTHRPSTQIRILFQLLIQSQRIVFVVTR